MVSKKLKIVCSVKVSRLKFVSLTIADQLQQNFCKMLSVEQRIIKLDWKSTMHSVVKCPKIFIFIFLCLIFSQFLILFVYLINIRHWQVPFITQEHLGKPSSTTSFFKCQGSTAAALAVFVRSAIKIQLCFRGPGWNLLSSLNSPPSQLFSHRSIQSLASASIFSCIASILMLWNHSKHP